LAALTLATASPAAAMPADCEAAFHQFDTGADNELDLGEFYAVAEWVLYLGGISDPTPVEVHVMFWSLWLDVDGNGVVTEGVEWGNVCS
jgi:hypothetical protein